MQDLEDIRSAIQARIDEAADLRALDEVRVSALGKKGEVSLKMRELGQMSPEERKTAGPALNALRDAVEAAILARKTALESAELDARLATERVDVTLPPAPRPRGAVHPVSQVMEEMATIFAAMGFSIAEGPDIESDFNNFTALNFPPGHPARDQHDTFFMKAEKDGAPAVLRTHTSPVQIRTMLAQQPPIRIIAQGRTYRNDSDQTHTPMFHQTEGLVVDRDVHMGHLKSCLMEFVSAYFERDVEVRFRPHHFPFTEPSAEMDVRYERVGEEIRIGQGDKWMEVAGCGMVHPNVLTNCGVDPKAYQGFAFGFGVDRLAMLKYGMPDLRDFFAADARWLGHYGFSALSQPSLATGLS